MIGTSVLNMKAALLAAQTYLQQDANAPVGLICQIYHALEPIDWFEKPHRHFQHWLLAGGNDRVDSISDAEHLFTTGFAFALEKLEYELG